MAYSNDGAYLAVIDEKKAATTFSVADGYSVNVCLSSACLFRTARFLVLLVFWDSLSCATMSNLFFFLFSARWKTSFTGTMPSQCPWPGPLIMCTLQLVGWTWWCMFGRLMIQRRGLRSQVSHASLHVFKDGTNLIQSEVLIQASVTYQRGEMSPTHDSWQQICFPHVLCSCVSCSFSAKPHSDCWLVAQGFGAFWERTTVWPIGWLWGVKLTRKALFKCSPLCPRERPHCWSDSLMSPECNIRLHQVKFKYDATYYCRSL